MVTPECLPTALSSTPEGVASTASAASVVSAEFTAVSKRRNFLVKHKLQILAESDRAVETGGISASLRREGLYSSALSDWRGQWESRHSGCSSAPRMWSGKGCGEPFARRTGEGGSRERHPAPPARSGGSDHRPPKTVAALLDEMDQASGCNGKS
jgi:hypothetical protein